MDNFDSWNKETDSLCPRRAFEAGQQSMQSKIEQLEKKLKAVNDLLGNLKDSMEDFKEFDLYDKGYRVTTNYIIRDLEEALRGES